MFQLVIKVEKVSKIFFCVTKMMIQLRDDKISLFEQPENLATKKEGELMNVIGSKT